MFPQVITPARFSDSRGWFSETWNAKRLEEMQIIADFCQDNHSLSKRAGTIRGLHFQQNPCAQAKLVRCLRGRIFDVAVDVRPASPTYKDWVGVELSAETGNQLFVPKGYAHGFLTLEDNCEISYKVDNYYAPEAEGGLAWNDPELAIDWPLNDLLPLLSDKDSDLPLLADIELDFAYDGNPMIPLSRDK